MSQSGGVALGREARRGERLVRVGVPVEGGMAEGDPAMPGATGAMVVVVGTVSTEAMLAGAGASAVSTASFLTSAASLVDTAGSVLGSAAAASVAAYEAVTFSLAFSAAARLKI